MAKKLNLIGMPIEDFESITRSSDSMVTVRKARLIPTQITKTPKKDIEEMALTSIFLSAVKLIKEFREDIFKELNNFGRTGTHYFYTEVTFSNNDEQVRPDGLILHVVSKKIKDAIIVEVKSHNNEIEPTQMGSYINVAKEIGVSRVLSISNQYVPDPSSVPYTLPRKIKGVETYHLSWQYLLTLAHILLHKNEHNIEDQDQVALMKEIVLFFESDTSGIRGFSQMKKGWKNVSETLKKKGSIEAKNQDVIDTIHSWQQEEMDMALILSRELGLFVETSAKKSTQERFDSDFKNLSEKKLLTTELRIPGTVSPIEITADFSSNTVSFTVKVKASEKTLKGRIGDIKTQLNDCKKKNPEIFSKIKDEISIKPRIKGKPKTSKFFSIRELDDSAKELAGEEITDFYISYKEILLKKDFEGQKKIIEKIESMLIDFYTSIVQYLKNPAEKAPPMKEKSNLDEESF